MALISTRLTVQSTICSGTHNRYPHATHDAAVTATFLTNTHTKRQEFTVINVRSYDNLACIIFGIVTVSQQIDVTSATLWNDRQLNYANALPASKAKNETVPNKGLLLNQLRLNTLVENDWHQIHCGCQWTLPTVL